MEYPPPLPRARLKELEACAPDDALLREALWEIARLRRLVLRFNHMHQMFANASLPDGAATAYQAVGIELAAEPAVHEQAGFYGRNIPPRGAR